MRSKQFIASILAMAMVIPCATFGYAADNINDDKFKDSPLFENIDISHKTNIVDMTTNYLNNPIGIEKENIVFSWKMDSNLVGMRQAAYQINLYHAEDLENIIWTSEKIVSDMSVGIPYGGQELELMTQYCWQVTVWDEFGDTYTSDSAHFETGITGLDEWVNTPFIQRSTSGNNSQAPVFRTEQKLSGNVVSARLYVTSRGVYTAYINGERVGVVDNNGETQYLHMAPGHSSRATTSYHYQTYDVTSHINEKTDFALSIDVGFGWAIGMSASTGRPSVKALLRVEYDDNSIDIFNTNTTAGEWRATTNSNSPITGNGVYWGESYDAQIVAALGDYRQTGYVEPDGCWENVAAYNFTGAAPTGAPGTNGYLLYDWELFPVSITAYTENTTPVEKPVVIGRTTYYSKTSKILVDDYFAYEQPENDLYKNGNVIIKPEGVSLIDDDGMILSEGQTVIVDVGQNHAGIPNLRAAADTGVQLQMRFAEILNDEKPYFSGTYSGDGGSTGSGSGTSDIRQYSCDGPEGSIFRKNLRGINATAAYTFAGHDIESYMPSTTYFGYRYIELKAIGGNVKVYSISSVPVSSVSEQIGHLETNNLDVNQLFSNTLWGQLSNYFTSPSDCAQRNEREGWTGDTLTFAKSSMYHFDSLAFMEDYEKIVADVTMVTGHAGWSVPRGNAGYEPGWSDLSIHLPWRIYEHTGDTATLERNWESMQRFMDFINANPRKENLGRIAGNSGQRFGDWLSYQATGYEMYVDLYYLYAQQIMAEAARVLGKTTESEHYSRQADLTMRAIINEHIEATPEGGIVVKSGNGQRASQSNKGGVPEDNAQTAILWLLKLGCYENNAMKEQLVELLVENIRNESPSPESVRAQFGENTLSTGFHGTYILNPVLTEYGQADVAYDLLLQDELPSWLYTVKNGATTMWERWDAYDAENGFGHQEMNSYNHYSKGAVAEWMYEYMLGIAPDYSANKGFKSIVLQPTIDTGAAYNNQERIEMVNGSYTSAYGTIHAQWTADAGELTSYSTAIPANTTADLYLPVNASAVENFKDVPGVAYMEMEEHNGVPTAKFNLAAGGYDFEIVDGVLVASLQDGYVDSGVIFDLLLTTDAYHIEAGDYVNITIEFAKMVNSNTAIINFFYDTELFEQRDFRAAEGVTLISRETTDTGARVVVMVANYDTQTYGHLALQAKHNATLTTGWVTVGAEAEYVVKDESDLKAINRSMGSISFTVYGEGEPGNPERPLPAVKGDTNGDGIIDLIDLSNMIDWFGIDNSNSEWDSWYTYFDFNNNGYIDIHDIAFVAQRI